MSTWEVQWNGHTCVSIQTTCQWWLWSNKAVPLNLELMHLLRCLLFFTAYIQFQFSDDHIAGVSNTAANALSWADPSLFKSQTSQVPRATVYPSVSAMLVSLSPNWRSKSWTELIRCCLLVCLYQSWKRLGEQNFQSNSERRGHQTTKKHRLNTNFLPPQKKFN